MGKGNAQKSAQARAKNQAKADEERGGGGGAKGKDERMGLKVMTTVCKGCLSAFMPTNSKKQLEEHVESKHPKSTFEICFPDYKA